MKAVIKIRTMGKFTGEQKAVINRFSSVLEDHQMLIQIIYHKKKKHKPVQLTIKTDDETLNNGAAV